jgi:hypothetical protein
VRGRGQAQPGGDRGDDQHRHGQQQEQRDHPRAFGREPLGAVAQPADHDGQAEDQQHVRQDRADHRGLDDRDQSLAEREDPEEQLGDVAQRGLHDPGGP